MPTPIVFVAESHAVKLAGRLHRDLTTEWDIRLRKPEDGPAELAAVMAETTALITFRLARDFPLGPKLRLIQSPGAGVDGMALDRIPTGCTLCNVFEHEIGISEFVLLGMLEWCIGLRAMDAGLRRGEWHDGPSGGGRTHDELFGKTVGIIGFGHIGKAVALRARAFGCPTRAVTRTPASANGEADLVEGMDKLDALLAGSDFVVVTLPLDDATRGLIGARELALMKPGSVIVNVGRGEVIAEQPLYEALRDRRIAGAVIDVWYTYPTADQPLRAPSRFPFRELDNVLMSPHASAWTEALFDRRWKVIADNLDRLVRGQPLHNVVR